MEQYQTPEHPDRMALRRIEAALDRLHHDTETIKSQLHALCNWATSASGHFLDIKDALKEIRDRDVKLLTPSRNDLNDSSSGGNP
jgi:hypothetical protein